MEKDVNGNRTVAERGYQERRILMGGGLKWEEEVSDGKLEDEGRII